MNRIDRLQALGAMTWLLTAATATAADVNDGQGKAWRQITETTSVSWTQLAEACPQDGATPCSGAAGTRDVAGWIWASAPQVIDLFALYDPTVVPSGNSSGPYSGFAANAFLSDFQPTFSFASTYQAGASASAWTASLDSAGSPLAGGADWSTNLVSFPGGFGIGPIADPSAVSQFRGAFLWRPTGLGTGEVFANDDTGSVASPSGGIGIANVLANDWVAGAPASLANATISASPAGSISLDPATGAVVVSPGATVGVHSLSYTLCAIADSARCDDAVATVVVPAYVIDAVNDVGTAPPTGGTALATVLANDTLGGTRATVGTVALSQLSSSHASVTLDASDGSIDVAAGAPLGAQSLTYAICERANPTNCDSATVALTIARRVVIAGDDYARATSKKASVAIASVFVNDTLGGVRASAATVRLSSVSAPIRGVTLNPSTGAVSVGTKTSSGTYALTYEICDLADLTNCDTAVVTLELSGRAR